MIVYLTINLINNKKYIGIDSKNNPAYLGSGKILKQAIEKYGAENFEKIILEECDNRKDLLERERYWIELFNAVESKDFYNLLKGGLGYSDVNPMFHTNLFNIWKNNYGEEEANRRMGILKSKRSEFSSGNKNSMYGKRNSGRCKYIGKFDTKGNLLEKFQTVREASLKCHHKRCNIAKWRKTGKPNYLRHIWKFISEEEFNNLKR